jgi:hypothetical protein
MKATFKVTFYDAKRDTVFYQTGVEKIEFDAEMRKAWLTDTNGMHQYNMKEYKIVKIKGEEK